MSAEPKNRVGHLATLFSGRLRFDVRIVSQKTVFGRVIMTVTPVSGAGEENVNEDTLANFREPK